MQIITNVVPTKELEDAVASELLSNSKQEIALAELIREAENKDDIGNGPRNTENNR
jgi:hypothetical protein